MRGGKLGWSGQTRSEGSFGRLYQELWHHANVDGVLVNSYGISLGGRSDTEDTHSNLSAGLVGHETFCVLVVPCPPAPASPPLSSPSSLKQEVMVGRANPNAFSHIAPIYAAKIHNSR